VSAPDESVLERLKEGGLEPPRVRLRDTAEEDAPLAGVELRATGRYEILGEIAEGGVGRVTKGRDVDLGRDVALKVLKERHLDNTDVVRRFVEEAQVGGQLQHPGVVPVYEMGLQEGRQPFFAMKLVKGRTLTALLDARGDDPRRYLAIFEQVCRTVAYAHARGVIHRDLKSSNVMVGAFGEVQVLDWGFAKVLAQGGVADERRAQRVDDDATVVSTVRSGSEGSESIPGSVMGTPAYMPPEQALGHVDALDERSDVFSLGAVLTEILTGAPPYTGDERLVKAARADLADAFARLDRCGADREMVALATRCLAVRRQDRPRHAGVVADAVTDHLAAVQERAHRSEIDAAEARAQAVRTREEAAEQRRARRQTIVLAASGLLAILVAVAGYAFLEHDRRTHARRTAEAVREAMREANLLDGRGEPQAALRAATRARESARDGGVDPELSAQVERLFLALEEKSRISREAEAQRRKDAAMVERLERIRMERGAVRSHEDLEEAFAAAFREYGIDVEDPSKGAASLTKSAIADELVMALDEWAWLRHIHGGDSDRLLAIARAVDDDPWRQRLRDAVGEGSLDALRDLASDTAELPVRDALLLARILHSERDLARAAGVLRRAVERHPDDFFLNLHLAVCLVQLTKRDTGRTRSDAIRYAQAAIAIEPDRPWPWYLLACARATKGGDLDGTEAALRHALKLHPAYGAAHNALAIDVLEKRGEREKAVEHYRKAIRLWPSFPETRANLGVTLVELGKVAEGLDEIRQAVSERPEDPVLLESLAWSIEHTQGQEAAREAWSEALRAYRKRLARNEDDLTSWERVMLILARHVGEPLADAEAVRQTVRLAPENPWYRWNLGSLLRQLGKPEEALRAFDTALALAPKDDRRARIFRGRASALLALHRCAEAAAALREALQCEPEHPHAIWNLGNALLHDGRVKEGLEQMRKALALGLEIPDSIRSLASKAERMLALLEHLPAIRDGSRQPRDNEERILFADLCYVKRHDAAAARLVFAAMQEDPSCEEDERYGAALAAAAAGDEEISLLDADERAAWRRRALAWLHAELEAAGREIEAGLPSAVRARECLVAWRHDARLQGFRGEAALARLPDDEREEWTSFWSRVDAVLAR
jgi:serine/threonine-protein kinase